MRIQGTVASVEPAIVNQEATLAGGAKVIAPVPMFVMQVVTEHGTFRAASSEAPEFKVGSAVIINIEAAPAADE